MDIMAALISFFLLDPLQSRLAERLEALRMPRAAVTQAISCARASTPAIANRVMSDPLWAAGRVYDVWIGGRAPEALLVELAPNCANAVEMLKGRRDSDA